MRATRVEWGAAILTKTGNAGEAAARGPLIRPERYGFFDKLLFAVFVLAVPPFIASNWSVFRDGDVSWHVAAGRWILEHGRVPKTDPFSFTMADQPWVAHEWLPEIAFALGFDQGGHAGLAAVVAIVLMALFAVAFAFLRRHVGPIAMLVAFASLYIVLQPFIMARPHVFAWAFLAGWTSVLLASRDAGRPPPWALVGLMFVWANVHASFFLGFVVAACVALDACMDSRWSRPVVLRWFLFGLASLVASLLNANGLPGFLHPFMISGMETLQSIAEWTPSTPRSTPFFYYILLAALAAILLKRPRFLVGEVLLLTLVLGLAFTHIRHQSVFMILAVLIVTPKFAGAGRKSAAPLFASPLARRASIAAAILMAFVIVAVRTQISIEPRQNFAYPRDLIAHIPAELRSQPVLNEYSIGGPLILNGVKVFIDGRADMYGDAFFSDYLKIIKADVPVFNRAVCKYGIRWTMLQTDNPMLKVLDASSAWKRIYSDKVGVIHVRTAQLPPRCPQGAQR